MFTEILIVVALILLNGVLAMSEMAIVSARPARLKSLESKSRGAASAPTFVGQLLAASEGAALLPPGAAGALLGPRRASLPPP